MGTDPRDGRCEHGIRWPHPCDDCHEIDMQPHNLIARIEALTAERDALREALAEARLQIELLEHAAQYPRD